MVSLIKLSEVMEDGVKFQFPYDQCEMLLTPKKSIEIQNVIGKNRPTQSIERRNALQKHDSLHKQLV